MNKLIAMTLLTTCLGISGCEQKEEKAETKVPATATPLSASLKVKGITCEGCAATLKEAVQAIPGVDSASASPTQGTVTYYSAQPAALKAAVAAAIVAASSEEETYSIDTTSAP